MRWLYDLLRCTYTVPILQGDLTYAVWRCERWAHLTGGHR